MMVAGLDEVLGAHHFRKESVTTKAVVWVTLISFTLYCTGCYSIFEGEDYPARVAHVDERQTNPHKENYDREFLEYILFIVVIFAIAIAGSYHGNAHLNYDSHYTYSGRHSHRHW